MSDISKIQTNGETYDVKDATARGNAEDALAQSDSASQLANEATDMATAAQSTADSKVSSVNIGTVTTGDEPAVTNSGTDKDVVMDFVFPSGDSPIISGTVPRGETLRFTTNSGLLYVSNPYDETATPSDYGCTLWALVGGSDFLHVEAIYGGGTMTALVEESGDVFVLNSPGREITYILIGATLVE